MIVCVVGQSCAGKTTACEYIEAEFGVPFVEGSDSVWNRYHNSSFSDDILGFVKTQYEKQGKDTFASPVIDRANKLECDDKVLCGFRTVEEINYLKHHYGEDNLFVLGIHANCLVRYQRKIKRDPHNHINYKKFVMKDFAEYQFGIAEILKREADKVLINESTFEEFYDDINETLSTHFN